jgi:predicted RecB family endonuclease
MRVPIRTPNRKKWSMAIESTYKDEAHLQDMIYKNPKIIPFEDINPESENRKLILIKELGLPGYGSIDVVVVDNSGDIYLIETKLATNPDIRRKVVGQILEYAAYLWERDFEWLDNEIKKKLGNSLTELFQDAKDWVKEDFIEAVTNNLQEGLFKLVIVVDRVTDELRRITKFAMKRGVAIHPVELRYFKDKGGTEVIVPKVFNVLSVTKVTPPARRIWDEKSFFEDARNKVDERTLSTLHKMYAFSKDLGEIKWGHGAKHGTFGVNITSRDKQIPLFCMFSSGKRNWFNFKKQVELGVNKTLIMEYIRHLKSLEFPKLDENKHWNRYPEFDISILNDDEKFASFKEATLKFKNLLAQS